LLKIWAQPEVRQCVALRLSKGKLAHMSMRNAGTAERRAFARQTWS